MGFVLLDVAVPCLLRSDQLEAGGCGVGVGIGMGPHQRSARIEVVDERGRVWRSCRVATASVSTSRIGWCMTARAWSMRRRSCPRRSGCSRPATAARPARWMRIRCRCSRCAPSDLVRVEVNDDLVVMGMLVDRRDEPGQARTQTINRPPKLLVELVPGGAQQLRHPRPQTSTLQRHLRPHAGRPEPTRSDRPGRALGDDSAIQRDRPDPGRRLFGQATSRTCLRPA
jgi:hypothetical protein